MNTVENVLIIVVDALRADRVGNPEDRNRWLTPAIDSIGEAGTAYENCYACTNVTDSSMTTIATGQYPARHGVINHASRVTDEERQLVSASKNVSQLLPNHVTTFAVDKLGRWHERGFETYEFPSEESEKSFMRNRLRMVKNSLPSRFHTPLEYMYGAIVSGNDAEGPNISHARADAVTNRALENIKTANGPWFGLVHYWDVHLPYPNLEEVDTLQLPNSTALKETIAPIRGSPWYNQLTNNLVQDGSTVEKLQQQYDQAVQFVDREIGRLLDRLNQIGVRDNTAIVVTADHGESFTEHNIFFDHHGLYDQSIHVPLLITGPDLKAQGSHFVQHFDLAPTVLDWFDVGYDANRFDGKSLLSEEWSRDASGRDAIYAEEAHTCRRRAVRTKAYKYIEATAETTTCRYCNIEHAPKRELYDLRTDPNEITNVVDEREDVAHRLATLLENWYQSIPKSAKEPIDFGRDDVAVERLESMGYI